MKFIAALFSFLIFTAPAMALGLHHSAAPVVPSSAPVLTAASYTLGQQTQAYRGYAFLHAQDQTIPSYIPFTVSGLGLMSPTGPNCDTWYMTYVSGRSATDFDISASVADASALTPLVNFTGQGHLTGDYIFNIQCSRAGVFSNTVPLTVHTIANACNIGPQDRLDFGWCPDPGFGSATGSKILISTGTDWHGLWNRLRGISLGSTTGNHLTITIADAGRYPYITDFNITGLSYVDLVDIVAVGDTDISGVGALFGAVGPTASTGNTLSNLRYYGSQYTLPRSGQQSGQGAFDVSYCGGPDPCIIQDSVADFASGGFNTTDGSHISNVTISHYNNNCAAVAPMSIGATVDNFTTCTDPLINQSPAALHTDCLQILDGATAWNLKVNNFWCIQAGASGDPQGPIFGGSQMGSKNDVTMGYIDDCTGAHGAGHYLTLTSGFYQSSSGGSQVWAPGGGLTIADNARINFGDIVGSCVGLTSGGTNISARNVGSVGTPVSISNVGAFSLQMEGVINTNAGFNGFASAGESGTSFLRHSTYQQQKQNPFPAVSFTGSVNGVVGAHASGTTVSATGFGTSNYPGVMEAQLSGYMNYSGCGNCNGRSAGSQGICCEFSSTEAANNATATATFSVSGGFGYMTVSGPCTGRFDYNVANGSQIGGLMISGSGIPESISIAPQPGTPADGCAGSYLLNSTAVGTLGATAVTGKPQNGAGLYNQFGTAATPVGPIAMTVTGADVVNQGEGASVTQDQSGGSPGCVTNLHQGTFVISKVLATYISTCGAFAPNTTTSNNVQTGVAADFATGILPYTSLASITAATWDAMTVPQKRAFVCNKLLPAVGHSLDLGGGDYIGAVTATGEIQLAGGNVAVPQCGIH